MKYLADIRFFSHVMLVCSLFAIQSSQLLSQNSQNLFSEELTHYLNSPDNSYQQIARARKQEKKNLITELFFRDHTHMNGTHFYDRVGRYTHVKELFFPDNFPVILTPQDMPTFGEFIFDACQKEQIKPIPVFFAPENPDTPFPHKQNINLVSYTVFTGHFGPKPALIISERAFEELDTGQLKERISETITVIARELKQNSCKIHQSTGILSSLLSWGFQTNSDNQTSGVKPEAFGITQQKFDALFE